jgi:hypothetical protein
MTNAPFKHVEEMEKEIHTEIVIVNCQYCINPRLYRKEFVIKIICLTLY